jgi:hypothetical protein
MSCKYNELPCLVCRIAAHVSAGVEDQAPADA